jgi:YgiT-type zinc finger domain-containing protein
MKGLKKTCSECGTPTELKEIVLHFERNSLKVRVTGVPAMVCPRCGQKYVPSSVSREVLEIVEHLMGQLEESFVAQAAEKPVVYPFKSITLAIT